MSADCGSDTGLCAHCGSFSDSLCDGAYNSIKSVVAKDERKRIIALAREKAERAAMKHRMTPSDVAFVDALVIFANELEAECE